MILECLPSISSDDDEDKEKEKRSIITYEEGKKAFGIFKQYIEQLDHATANDISFLNNLMKKAKKERIDKLKQSKLIFLIITLYVYNT